MSTKINHVAIIMDGNGRWAKERGRPRIWGHVRGSAVVSRIVEEANNLGIKALTLYAFSTENWSRPLDEITILFKLLAKFLGKEEKRIVENNIQFKVIGDIRNLPAGTISRIRDLEHKTRLNTGLKLSFAFGYGSREEMVNAVNRFIALNPGKPITEKDIAQNLYRPESGEVDLLIRTGGEIRVSNFLLWQIAYSELWFTETKWPDFSEDEFKHILNSVESRERRFGGVGAGISYQRSVESSVLNKTILQTGVQ